MPKSKGPNPRRVVGDDVFIEVLRKDGSVHDVAISATAQRVADRHRIFIQGTKQHPIVGCYCLGEKSRPEKFSRVLMGAAAGQVVRCLDGNPLNLRHSNLVVLQGKNGPAKGANRFRVEGNVAYVTLEQADGTFVAETEVDADLVEILRDWRLHRNGDGYVRCYRLGESRGPHVFLHHLVCGQPPPGHQVDHVNRRRLDNRRANLRFATPSQQNMNQAKRRDNTSGHKNVFDRPAVDGSSRFSVLVTAHGKRMYRGGFRNVTDAIAYRDALLREMHGAFGTFG